LEKTREIDSVGNVEFFAEFVKFFGTRRAMELAGWAVLWGVTGKVDNIVEYRQELIARGMARSSVYRATLDFRKFREYLEGKEGVSFADMDVMRKIGALSSDPL
jgi:hypothetical protein